MAPLTQKRTNTMSMITLIDLADETKRQMAAITGLTPDTISRLDRVEGGWALSIDMLEHRSIPRTQDLLASFEVKLDDEGKVASWHRIGRFVRGQQG
jgi:hypothetical protein